jgi:enamine deaminase RidA (YjgF/YER057c/UK114 family)
MTTPSVRLTELGITLPTVAAPIAAYLPAVADGHHIYVSGQLPLVDGALEITGRLGSDVDTEVACTPTFGGQAAVINGASELLAAIFGDQGRHARSAVGVAALPLNAAVEVELLLGYA